MVSDRVEEVDVDVQTDAFLDRPPSPLFIPAKTGIDVETQILEGDVCSSINKPSLIELELQNVFYNTSYLTF